MRTADVVVKRELVNLAHDFPFETDLAELQHTTGTPISEQQYVTALLRARELYREVGADLARAVGIADRLRALAAGEDWINLEREYARDQHLLFGVLEWQHARGSLEIGSAPTAGGTRVRSLQSITKGDFSVEIPGGSDLRFYWSHRSGAGKSRARSIAQRFAEAFATRDRIVLLETFDQIRQSIPQISADCETLIRGVESELANYRRVVATSLMANKGRMPFAAISQAQLVIDLKGYPRQGVSESEKRSDPRVQDDVVIDMQAVIEDEMEKLIEGMRSLQPRGSDERDVLTRRETHAIAISEPATIEWLARDAVTSHEFTKELVSAYASGERTAYMRLNLIRPSRKAIRLERSKAVPFRDVGDASLLRLDEKPKRGISLRRRP